MGDMSDRRKSDLERRKAQRTPFVAAVKQESGREVELALMQDLGTDGARLKRVGGARAPRSAVSLSFELPDGGDLVRVQGAVVFERAAGGYQTTGIRFTAMTARDHARIARLLASL
jgi:hypothetical protein